MRLILEILDAIARSIALVWMVLWRIAVLTVLLLMGYAAYSIDPVYLALECTDSEECIIRHNPGGFGLLFVWAAWSVNRHERTIVIDGTCASACAIFADKARTNVCITPRARFLFHKALNPLNGERSDPDSLLHSSDIIRWVNDRGGFPSGNVLLEMSYEHAKDFWHTCPLRSALVPRGLRRAGFY